MDLEIEFKEEPALLEGTTNASIPSKDIKEEIFIEEHTDDQLLPYIKEETKSTPDVSNADHQPPDGGAPCFLCNVCGQILAGKLDLLRHLRGHKDDRFFKCDHCGKIFGSGSSLSEHLRNHELQVCEFRHKCFANQDTLTEHLHLHTRRVVHECSVCHKFRNSLLLTYHMRSHTGGRSNCCNICGELFSYKGNLAVHMRSHAGAAVKPCCCNVCGKSFSRRLHLNRHMRTHARSGTVSMTVASHSTQNHIQPACTGGTPHCCNA